MIMTKKACKNKISKKQSVPVFHCRKCGIKASEVKFLCKPEKL
jgi:ribosomal protein L37AE/L43A